MIVKVIKKMKILVTYDIDEEDEDIRIDIEKLLKRRLDWIRLQKSVWIVRSNKMNYTDISTYIKRKFKNKDSLIATIDISNKTVECNNYKELKDKNSLTLLTDKY